MGLPVEVNNLMMGSLGGYTIGRSLRFRSSASAYLNRTPSVAGNQKTWTWSAWVKRGTLSTSQVFFIGYVDINNKTRIGISSGDILQVYDITGGSTERVKVYTTQVLRDPSAWYHIVVAMDTTQATAANRTIIYINGVQVTSLSSAVYPSQNTNLYIDATNAHALGGSPPDSLYVDGYLAEVNFIDGQALTPSSFGETDSITGIWNPKKYSGTYGTNGFYLNFSDNSAATAAAIGKDSSGNGNNWTPNNISVTSGTTYDSMIDSPTPYADGGNGRGNYAVINPLMGSTEVAFSNANLKVAGGASTNFDCSYSSIGMTSGKWYAEFTVTLASNATQIGVGSYLYPRDASNMNGNATGITMINLDNSTASLRAVYINGTGLTGGDASFSFATNDIIGIAFDASAKTVTFYKNGSVLGSTYPYSVTDVGTGIFYFMLFTRQNVGTSSLVANFGQQPFSYTPPSGFNALNTYNLPSASISNGAKHFATSLVTGTGGVQTVNNTVNNASFQPDFIWWKSRSNASNHILMNSITGVGPFLRSNTTDAEQPSSGLTSYNSNGFSVNGSFDNTYTFVAWQWKGGGTAVTNNNGTITSQVSANTSAGISIITYTGSGANATVGHGLGTVPSFMIIKNRSSGTTDWRVWSSSFSAPTTGYLALNTTAAGANATTMWNSSLPTSSVINLGSSNSVNGSGNDIIAYCFSAVRGFSAFGSYTGNGSADGPFIYTGFRPRFVLVKDSSAAQNWRLFDSSRSTYNAVLEGLFPNLSNAESAAETGPDFLSNGFKIRTSSATHNASGNTIIYAAFAENPFNYSRAR